MNDSWAVSIIFPPYLTTYQKRYATELNMQNIRRTLPVQYLTTGLHIQTVLKKKTPKIRHQTIFTLASGPSMVATLLAFHTRDYLWCFDCLKLLGWLASRSPPLFDYIQACTTNRHKDSVDVLTPSPNVDTEVGQVVVVCKRKGEVEICDCRN